MSLADLVRRDVPTRFGPVPVFCRPEALAASGRPLVLALPGGLGGAEEFVRLPQVMAAHADAAVLALFGLNSRLTEPGIAPAASAVAEVIEALFPERRIVLLGASAGALAALGVDHPAVRRIVAVEPPLATGKLWPLVPPFRRRFSEAPGDASARALAEGVFGVGVQRIEARDYTSLLAGLTRPTDVILGDVPLLPERSLPGLPSLLAAPERVRLAAHPQVRLHIAKAAGHMVQNEAAVLVRDVLVEACRRACAEPLYDVRGLDEVLVEAVPLTARKVLHWGPGGLAFAGAYLSWNPAASIEVAGEAVDAVLNPAPGGYDAIALGVRPSREVLARASALLATGGHLIVRADPADIQPALAAQGLAARPPLDPAAFQGVLRAQKLSAGVEPERPLRLETVVFAGFLMDVRTRLPLRGLASDPELDLLVASGSHSLTPLSLNAPKVLVMQRPGPSEPEREFSIFVNALARGWIVVMEYDDHPGLVAEAHSRPFGPDSWRRFGLVHAIQTATEALREVFAHVGPEVQVFDNRVFELAPFPVAEPPPKVFYGAVSRGGFGVEVARSLAPVVAAVPDVEFVVLGDREVFEALPTAKKRYDDFLPYEGYLARMAECAVSLSPIEALPMRETKSDAKFLDAARAGVLTIGSPLIYGQTIRHGENGLVAQGLEDWAPLLLEALTDRPARRVMARTAWDKVRRHRMFADQVAARRDWYRELWRRRETLTAQAFARIPGLEEAVAARRAELIAQTAAAQAAVKG